MRDLTCISVFTSHHQLVIVLVPVSVPLHPPLPPQPGQLLAGHSLDLAPVEVLGGVAASQGEAGV